MASPAALAVSSAPAHGAHLNTTVACSGATAGRATLVRARVRSSLATSHGARRAPAASGVPLTPGAVRIRSRHGTATGLDVEHQPNAAIRDQ